MNSKNKICGEMRRDAVLFPGAQYVTVVDRNVKKALENLGWNPEVGDMHVAYFLGTDYLCRKINGEWFAIEP